MAQSKSTGSQNKQSATEADVQATPSNKKDQKARKGKEAASHTKAGSNEGAGGGKKRARQH